MTTIIKGKSHTSLLQEKERKMYGNQPKLPMFNETKHYKNNQKSVLEENNRLLSKLQN